MFELGHDRKEKRVGLSSGGSACMPIGPPVSINDVHGAHTVVVAYRYPDSAGFPGKFVLFGYRLVLGGIAFVPNHGCQPGTGFGGFRAAW